MAMRALSGTPVVYMAMAPPEWREYVPTSSWSNLSLSAPTDLLLTLTTEMMFKMLTRWRPWDVR